MNRRPIPIIAMAFIILLALLMPTSSAQTTGPDNDVEITCDQETYHADFTGIIEIICKIENVGSVPKNLQVGSVFDDWMGYEVEFLEILINGSDVSGAVGFDKIPLATVRSRVLSLQPFQTDAGAYTELYLKIRVPVGSSGKFDIIYGNPIAGNEYRLDPWWDTDYSYKECFNLSGHTQNLTGDTWDNPWGYPFNLTMNTQNLIATGKMQDDCDDVRLIFNDSAPSIVPKYFMRDCNQSVSEVWGLWNFTVGEVYEFCVYYGNTTVSSNYSDRHDIIFTFEDFDKFPFNWSDYYNITSWQSARNPPYAVVSDGILKFHVGSTGGNSGFGVIRNNTYFNISKTGMLLDFEYWYASTTGTGGWTTQIVQATNQNQPQIYQGSGNNYATCRFGNYGNCSAPLILNYISGTYDMTGYGENATNTSGEMDFRWYNYSNYYTSTSQWNRWMVELNPANCSDNFEDTPRNTCMMIYGDYAGQPYTDPIIRRNWSYYWGASSNPINNESNPNPSKTLFPYNATLYYSSSIGAGGSNQVQGQYDFWFARPYQDGEPNAVSGGEIPLNNATLVVSFTSPTPDNASVVSANPVIINVTSNKTIEWCKIDLNGTNYTMSLDTDYCYYSFNASNNGYSYSVFVEDFWGYQNETEQREFIYSGPPQITIYAPVGIVYNSQDVYVNVSADETVDVWLYNLNGSANSTFTPNTTINTGSDGWFLLTVWTNDTYDVWGSSTVEFGVDSVVTDFYLLSPLNQSYHYLPIPLNVTVGEPNVTFNYMLNGGSNNSFVPNITIGNLTEATHHIEVYAQDTYGNLDYDDVWFYYWFTPAYSEFASDPETTNFSAEANFSNVSDPIVADSNAKIEWTGSGYDVYAKDLDSAIDFGYNFVYLNGTELPTFDASATVTLKGVSYLGTNQYRVLRDGSLCTDCVKLDDSPAQFTVTGFSNYTTEFIPATTQIPILAIIPFILIAIVLLAVVGSVLRTGEIDLKMIIIAGIMLLLAVIFAGVMFAV